MHSRHALRRAKQKERRRAALRTAVSAISSRTTTHFLAHLRSKLRSEGWQTQRRWPKGRTKDPPKKTGKPLTHLEDALTPAEVGVLLDVLHLVPGWAAFLSALGATKMKACAVSVGVVRSLCWVKSEPKKTICSPVRS